MVVGAIAEAHQIERVQGAFALFMRLDAMTVVKHRHLDIFQRRRARKQVETLEDKANFFGRSSAPIMFISVLLPEPLAPMRAANSPGKTSSEIPRTAWTSTSPV
jgi:hypothetical protein